MIRKHALTLAWILIAVMMAATLWRISLLPEWTRLSMAQESGAPLRGPHSAWLFLCPGGLAFAVFVHMRSMRLAEGKPESVQAVRSFSNTLLLAMVASATVMQGIILGRSLGVVLPYEAIARCGFVLMGLLMMLFGNRLPKLPWITSKAACLDDADAQKLRRLIGLWLVVSGLAYVLAGLLFQPLRLVVWVALPLIGGGLVGILAYSRWLRRHPISGAR